MSAIPQSFVVTEEEAGMRLDRFLAARLPEVSRTRLQELIEKGLVLVGEHSARPSSRLRGLETITIMGAPARPPLRAIAEEIPLDIVYEDQDLAVINKPAGMMVHAGAGATDEARNRGTLVNALLHRFGKLSDVGGELRPGIVHRLDRETSGLIIVAKNDLTHRKLSSAFANRQIKKTYLAMVHGWPKRERGTINAPIRRDPIHRTRMTVRGSGGREAITHYSVQKRLVSPNGKFAMLEVQIDTGRTHQIRVHLASLGHPVVGDKLYGAPAEILARGPKKTMALPAISLSRNFLHAANLQFAHPIKGTGLNFSAPLPQELLHLMAALEGKSN
ncbi:MAG TPA: RluA family pseudouridine synthase [Terriglobales bacterium]|nr:RluA family pseudouridine synthase [Terriglobales bacterium]